MGALFSAGWSLDDVLGLSWEQLSFVVTTVNSHQAQILRTIQEAIVVSMGGSIKKDKKRKPRSKSGESTSNLSAAEKEKMKLMALQKMGIAVGPPTS